MNRRTEAGFASIAVAGLLLVLLAVSSLVAVLGAVAVARHRAASAADLSALAAAAHALEGTGPACRAAAHIAQRQGARVRACWVEGLAVVVEVSVRPSGPLGSHGEARAISRAGPTH